MSAHPQLQPLTKEEEEKRTALEATLNPDATLGQMFEFFQLQTRYMVLQNQKPDNQGGEPI